MFPVDDGFITESNGVVDRLSSNQQEGAREDRKFIYYMLELVSTVLRVTTPSFHLQWIFTSTLPYLI